MPVTATAALLCQLTIAITGIPSSATSASVLMTHSGQLLASYSSSLSHYGTTCSPDTFWSANYGAVTDLSTFSASDQWYFSMNAPPNQYGATGEGETLSIDMDTLTAGCAGGVDYTYFFTFNDFAGFD